jgi:RES domain-containing protein
MTIVYRIEKKRRAEMWPSQGSLFSEGRWNRQGFWIIYCSATISLAKLEMLTNSKSLPKERVLLEISIEEQAPIKEITLESLPAHWIDIPYPPELHVLTEKLLNAGEYVGLKVPSRQSPREYNYLLYPLHPQFSQFVKLESS